MSARDDRRTAVKSASGMPYRRAPISAKDSLRRALALKPADVVGRGESYTGEVALPLL